MGENWWGWHSTNVTVSDVARWKVMPRPSGPMAGPSIKFSHPSTCALNRHKMKSCVAVTGANL